MTKSKSSTIKVLITTAHRGVFFGEIAEADGANKTIYVTNQRNCLRWQGGLKGFLDLAVKGPNNECRVGPAAPGGWLHDITNVVICTPEAAKAWEAAPWN